MKSTASKPSLQPIVLRPTAYRFSAAPMHPTQTPTDLMSLRAEIVRLEALVVEQQGRIEALTRLSTTDALTGLTNVRGFETALAHALSDHNRYGYQGALISLDLNGFKYLNDTYGHRVGDAALVHVARILDVNTRTTDVKARLGGDEFVILMKEADAAQANAKAHQLATLFNTTTFDVDGEKHRVSASLGVATMREAPSAESLTSLADRRMYQAKAIAATRSA